MRRQRKPGTVVALLLALAAAACSFAPLPAPPPAAPPAAPHPAPVRITILQLNDVYEIQPIAGGGQGGLARVATVRGRLLADNPHTLTVLAGDFFSPSALGTARVDGERLAGRQMVDVLNLLGLDLATFGNHEFDLSEEQFLDRLHESRFRWVSSNVADAGGSPFPGVSAREVFEFVSTSGQRVRVGFVGATLDDNKAPYVTYGEVLDSLRGEVEALRPEVDVLVALTHLDAFSDQRLAEQLPQLDLVLGGHEHENMLLLRGESFTHVAKADANAKSVYIHELTFYPSNGGLEVASHLLPIDGSVPSDPVIERVVEGWVERAFDAFRVEGFDPSRVVAVSPEALDGREAAVRNGSTILTRLLADALRAEAAGCVAGVFNGGSIRIDDVLPPGPVTQYDVLRVLPFGGEVYAVEVEGSVLARLLSEGTAAAARGQGRFLQTTANVTFDGSTWRLDGEAVEAAALYRIGVNDYLANGNQDGLEFFDVEEPDSGATRVAVHRDVRMALIDELARRYPP